ncbi:MAG: replication initiator protein A [Chitinophagales bacterium]|nr:replication initiator protein A [Chitinophagales bacterium]
MSQKQEELALLPERHPTKDFFIADIFDNLPFKDDMASMEHPMFSLSKNRDLRQLEYVKGDIRITVAPSTYGLPTIFDKDVLLYCGSLLMDQINKGQIPPRTLRISSHDLLVATNRPTNGQGYQLLKKALDRLKGVSIKTNIKTNKREVTQAFGLIESYHIVESNRVKNRMIRLEITLSEWFYQSILGKEVLTINKDYFRLGKALERRLYEIARKHCGRSASWQIHLKGLKEKVGSTSSLVKFRYFIREITRTNYLPDYTIAIDAEDRVTFRNRETGALYVEVEDLPAIRPDTIKRGAQLVAEAGTGWDYEAIREQFTLQVMKGFRPDNIDGAFIGFVRKKVAATP